ncbi:MAG: N-6 DNA methylase, partial [Planctomycetes bacterium]|nr:N-6 DNA methylase [Planctomycetota bacterium]
MEQDTTRHSLLAQKTLLSLKVCDPACGSGHFLIAAANRLSHHLATARTGDEEPSPAARRVAFRDVVSHCIYGVDINPMAVELCKVALWLESIDPGRPLSFLDHRILCGNSLIGVTPRLLAEGIPDDAFKPITGDDKAVVNEYRRRNKDEKKGQLQLDFGAMPSVKLGNLVQFFANLAAMGDGSLEDVEAKEKRYAEFVDSTGYQSARLLADAWCAAFVWIKRLPASASSERRVASGEELLATHHSPLTNQLATHHSPLARVGFDDCITESWFRRIEANPHCLPPWMREEIARLRDQYQFFHWHLAFPDAFRVPAENEDSDNEQTGWTGGFDVVLGNPPWEKVKLQEREWFSSSSPDIPNATTAAHRRELVAALSTTNQPLFLAYKHALRHSEASTAFVRNSTRFKFGASGDTNTYPLFIENARMCINQHGRSGLVVKTGILADYSMRDFFSDLVESNALVSAHDFSNRRLIFPGVVANERFTLLTIGARADSGDSASISILNDGVETIRDQARAWTLSGDDVRLINPNTKTCPLFQTAYDAQLVKRIYCRHPILLKESASGEESPWKAQYYTMFHMSNDSGLFHDLEELQQRDAAPPSPRWVARDEEFVSVTEGKLFDQFDHRHGDFRGIPRAKRFGIKAEPNHPTPEGYRDPLRTSLPRYWVLADEPHRRWIDRLGFVPGGVVAFRDVCRTHTDLRTVRASVVPAHGPGNKAPLLIFPGETKVEHARRSIFAAANLNTFALDYVARQKFSGGSLNRYILIQLPVCENAIGPSSLGRQHKRFVHEGLELSYTAWDLEPFAKDCGYDGPPFRWDEE